MPSYKISLIFFFKLIFNFRSCFKNFFISNFLHCIFIFYLFFYKRSFSISSLTTRKYFMKSKISSLYFRSKIPCHPLCDTYIFSVPKFRRVTLEKYYRNYFWNRDILRSPTLSFSFWCEKGKLRHISTVVHTGA